MLGAAVVVVNGVPGLTLALAPHWRGDLILILSGLAYAAYSLIGRDVLTRHPALAGDRLLGRLGRRRRSLPLALSSGPPARRPPGRRAPSRAPLYLGVVMTALGYAVWNWCLERVEAPRAWPSSSTSSRSSARCSGCGGCGSR